MARTDYLHFRQNSIIYFYYNIADLLTYRAYINTHNYLPNVIKIWNPQKNDWVINIEQNL